MIAFNWFFLLRLFWFIRDLYQVLLALKVMIYVFILSPLIFPLIHLLIPFLVHIIWAFLLIYLPPFLTMIYIIVTAVNFFFTNRRPSNEQSRPRIGRR